MKVSTPATCCSSGRRRSVPRKTPSSWAQRLAVGGSGLLVRTLAELSAIQPEPQDDSQATYAPILKKEDGKIDWQLSAREILNRIRGFEPWPGGYGFLRGQRLQIWSAAIGDQKLPPGALRAVNRKLYAGCGREESIELREVQLEGKKRMPAAAFMNGFPTEWGRGAAVNLPLGISLRGGLRGTSQGQEGRPGADRIGHARGGRRRVHAESRGGGAGGAGAQESAGVARQGVARSW